MVSEGEGSLLHLVKTRTVIAVLITSHIFCLRAGYRAIRRGAEVLEDWKLKERFTGDGNRQIETPVVQGIPPFSRLGMVLVYATVELLLVGQDNGGGRVHTKK